MIRFLIDAQLPTGLVSRLVARGYAAEHVHRIGLGDALDNVIWNHAISTGAVLITKDEDFAMVARRSSGGAQVVWIRLGNIGNDALWRAIEPLLDTIDEALAAGERIVEVI